MQRKGGFVPVGDIARAMTSAPHASRSMTTREFLTAAAEARRAPRHVLLPGYLDTLEACVRANDCAVCRQALSHLREAPPVALRHVIARDVIAGFAGPGRKVG